MYITDPEDQKRLIKEMTQLRRDLESYEVFFHHPYTNQTWKSFFPRALNDDLGPKLLRHEPLPENINDVVSICLSEDVPQNAIGLGIELSVSINTWPEVVDFVDQNNSDLHSGQVRLFLQNLGMENYRETIERFDINSDSLNLSEKELKKLVWWSRKIKLKSFFR